MRRYTTPTHSLVVEGVDLTDMDVFVTYAQGCNKLTLQPDDATYDVDTGNTTVEVTLSQAQTASFVAGKRVAVQVNAIDSEGRRNSTSVKEVVVTQNLLDEEIEYGG